MEYVNVADYDSLSLAYVGDAVWELELRKEFAKKHEKHHLFVTKVKKYVNAKFQNLIYLKIFDELDDYEAAVSKRARNCVIKSYPKSCSPIEYRNATAFEALIGYYHLSKKENKICEIIQNYIIKGEE